VASKTILIVEDEGIVAIDIRNTLERLGYGVGSVVSYGEEAVTRAAETMPDLVLMDIMLKGHMDGIEAADLIRQRLDIPVVYLTAHADKSTLERARVTEPFGYVMKPFQERELYTTIEMALYKHSMEVRSPDEVESRGRYRQGFDGSVQRCQR